VKLLLKIHVILGVAKNPSAFLPAPLADESSDGSFAALRMTIIGMF
jgi:hypothetical protein